MKSYGLINKNDEDRILAHHFKLLDKENDHDADEDANINDKNKNDSSYVNTSSETALESLFSYLFNHKNERNISSFKDR